MTYGGYDACACVYTVDLMDYTVFLQYNRLILRDCFLYIQVRQLVHGTSLSKVKPYSIVGLIANCQQYTVHSSTWGGGGAAYNVRDLTPPLNMKGKIFYE